MRATTSFSIHGLIYGLAACTVASFALRTILIGGVGASAKTPVTFWNGFTGPDGVVMLGIIDHFNQENPDVHVSMQRIPWATYYNKLTVAGSDHRGPSVFIVHADAMARVRRAGFIEPADRLYEGAQRIEAKDFDPKVFTEIQFGGHPYGVPLDIHPQGMFCNADDLKQAGLLSEQGKPEPPKTRAEMLSDLRRLMAAPHPTGGDRPWGFALTNWGANMRSLMAQFDGRYLDEKGNAVFNSPQNIQALQFIADLTKDNLVPPPSNGLGWFGFRQGKVGMVWDGVFMLGDLKRVETFHYIGAPIPTIGNHPGTLANSHVMCIRKGLSPKEREACERFIRYVSAHNLDWAEAGQVPARMSARRTPRFAGMQVQHAFAEQIPWMQYPPRTPLVFEIGLILDLAVEKVVRSQATPKAALDEATKAAQTVIDRDRQEHPEDQSL